MFRENDSNGTWESIGAFFDTAWGGYVGAFIVLVFAWVVRFVFIHIVENYLMYLARRTKSEFRIDKEGQGTDWKYHLSDRSLFCRTVPEFTEGTLQLARPAVQHHRHIDHRDGAVGHYAYHRACRPLP